MPKDVGQYLYRENKNSIKNNLGFIHFNGLNLNFFGLRNLSFKRKKKKTGDHGSIVSCSSVSHFSVLRVVLVVVCRLDVPLSSPVQVMTWMWTRRRGADWTRESNHDLSNLWLIWFPGLVAVQAVRSVRVHVEPLPFSGRSNLMSGFSAGFVPSCSHSFPDCTTNPKRSSFVDPAAPPSSWKTCPASPECRVLSDGV